MLDAAAGADGGRTWTPGVKLGVAEASWFHQTECFGPVLGLMQAPDLAAAIRMQNGTEFGLTGGIHTLDPGEIDRWVDDVEVGNAYVNRTTTGAIVQRQPFGGWKKSSVGPGAKAGGPNYVAQLGEWSPVRPDGNGGEIDHDERWLVQALIDDERWGSERFSIAHDPTGLFCESNVFRYRPMRAVMVRVTEADPANRLARVIAAATTCGVEAVVSRAEDESPADASARASAEGIERIRVVGPLEPELRDRAAAAGIHTISTPVLGDSRRELLHFLREQSVSRTMHRYGNLV